MNNLKLLRNLVLADKCLLHGSPTKIHEIHPHYTDDEMAICATPFPEIAIFMAVTKACRPGTNGFAVQWKDKKCTVTFNMCNSILNKLLQHEVKGYVYVLDSTGFKKRNWSEHRAYESLYSEKILTVTKEHLPFIPVYGQTHYKVPLNPLLALHFN